MGNKMIVIYGVLVALIFIGAMYGISSGIFSTGQKLVGDAKGTHQLVISAELEPYNNEYVTGDTVISAIKKFEYTANGSAKYTITVDGTTYGWTSTGYKRYDSKTDPTINPVERYHATLVVNANGVVTGIEFN